MILAGQLLGDRFEIVRRIGAGGMGEVFEAIDRDRGEHIAVKTLARAGGDVLARFKREFRALQSTAHPNLVSIRELVCVDGLWLFTMELVAGVHFLEHVRPRRAPTGDRPRVDLDRLRGALGQLALGLGALHDAGLVHRDIKPSNVMVTPEGRVVVLDFGLVTELDPHRQSSAAGPIGTVEYMAPEQAAGRAVGAAADWYAVGVMLHEALTGRVPHDGHALQILVAKQEREPPPPDDAPPELAALCAELLRIEPARRPDGAEVARRLGVADARSLPTPTLGPGGVFVGRDPELAALAAAIGRARAAPLVHLVVGESGIGKSELVARAARAVAADEPGALVLAGRCYERESVPYKALDGVADGLAHELARLPDEAARALLPGRPAYLVRLFPVFQRVAAIAAARSDGAEPADARELRRRLFGALRALLVRLTQTRRVIVTIDDLQWADADSFLLLRELLRGDGAPAVCVLATVRGGGDEADQVAARLGGLATGRTALGPLTADESLALAERLVPGAAARFDLGRISREAAGHPMFLHEILRHLAGGAAHEPSATLEDALRGRVAVLGADARAVLELVCVAGGPLSLDTAAVAADLDATRVARAAASLRVASLAREVQRDRQLALEPYHDRVREAVARRLPDAERRARHARLAAALEAGAGPRDPQLLLEHFVLAGEPARAARYAEEAAARSEAAHAFDLAAELWRTALRLAPDDAAERRRLELRAGAALINAGRGAEAAEHYLAAARGADRATRLECHRHAAEQLIISGRVAPGIAALEALLAELGVRTASTPRGRLASLLARDLWLRVRGTGFRERDRREIADAEILELEVLRVAASSLSMVDSIRGAEFQARHLAQALRVGHRPHLLRALLIEALFQATRSRKARAQAMLDRAIALGAGEHDPYSHAMVHGARGAIAYFGGDLVTALAELPEAEALLREAPGNNWEDATARLVLIFAQRFVGDYVALRARYEQYVVEAAHRGDRYLDSTMRRACVPMWLAEDDPAGARRDLAAATWEPLAAGFHVQHFHELVALAELALYERAGRAASPARAADAADAAALAPLFARLRGSLLLRIESIRVQELYLRGRLALAGLVPGDALAIARRLAREPNPLAAVWARLIRAGAEVARDRAVAAATLAEAAAAADAAGLRATGAAARRRRAELTGAAAAADLAAADLELAALGVRAPARLAALLVPLPDAAAP